MELNQVINTMYEGYVLRVVYVKTENPSVEELVKEKSYLFTSSCPVPALNKVLVRHAQSGSYTVVTVLECGTEELLDLSYNGIYQPIISVVDTVNYQNRQDEILELKQQFQKQMRINLREKLLMELKSALPEITTQPVVEESFIEDYEDKSTLFGLNNVAAN